MSLTQVPLSGADAVLIGLGAFAATAAGLGWRFLRHGSPATPGRACSAWGRPG